MLLDQILFHVPCPIFWKDLKGAFLGCNKLFLEISGFVDYNQLIGKVDEELPWSQYAKDYAIDDQFVITTGKTMSRVENIPLKDRTIISETTKAPLIQDGKTVGVLGICLDITDRKEKERLELENQAHVAAALEQQLKFRDIAAQVAHDITSPIAALQMILPYCNILPEDTRNALNQFSVRIIDIANNFLSHFRTKHEESVDSNARIPALIYNELNEIVTEKKYEYANNPIYFNSNINPNSYFTFITVDVVAFKRMISNLINNAVDAFDGGHGTITTHLDVIGNKVQIIIEDNGKGMPKSVKDKIMQNITVTSGKTDGHGIGFGQIRDTLANNGGSFSIESEIGKGTKVRLTFPKIEAPKWVASQIVLNSDDMVVILDDEPYIHEAWECRFKYAAPNILRQHFEQGEEAISFLNSLTESEKKKVFLLTDYQLLKQNLNGLNVVDKANIKRSILVTSHHNNQKVRDLAKVTNTKILPKQLASEVKIVVQ